MPSGLNPVYFYNTATRRKEEFIPLQPGRVGIYACGPTVYDYFHVGNARAFVVADAMRRMLEHRGYVVTLVQNITDVDDKIIARAQQEKREARAVAAEFTSAFFEDLQALGCKPAEVTPKATEHIPEIIALGKRLIETGHAYFADGDVYFSVESFPGYGSLSGKNTEALESGARVEINAQKRNPLDFALWKTAKPGEPFWDSPWGPGRPGWHIECSAMSMKYLGEQFDIHTGGEDLVFPHHENENAQSQSITGKPLARYWLHNGFLKISGEKMSKSSGNFKIVREVLRVFPAQVVRLFLLSAHYRSPLDFNPENIGAAQQGYLELSRTLDRLRQLTPAGAMAPATKDAQPDVLEETRNRAESRFMQGLSDDFNTALALGQMFALANQVRKILAGRPACSAELFEALGRARQTIEQMTRILGIEPRVEPVPEKVREWLHERELARKRRDWARADHVRDCIHAHGYEVEDTVFGQLALAKEGVIQ